MFLKITGKKERPEEMIPPGCFYAGFGEGWAAMEKRPKTEDRATHRQVSGRTRRSAGLESSRCPSVLEIRMVLSSRNKEGASRLRDRDPLPGKLREFFPHWHFLRLLQPKLGCMPRCPILG